MQVSQGGSQTFTITPNANYTIASVTVDGLSVGAVSTYTFNNVTTTHTISATFNSTLGSVVSIFKSGAGINMTYTTNLDSTFQNAGSSNVVQVICDDTEMTTNANADYSLRGTAATTNSTGDYAYLVKWDLSSLPVGATVVKAEIRLYATNGNNGSVYVSPILTHNWTQATEPWPVRITPPARTGPGARLPTPYSASADLGTIPTFSGAYVPVANPVVVDVTSDLQAIVNGTQPNYGWAFVGSTTFTQGTTIGNHSYYTQDNADATTHPAPVRVLYIRLYDNSFGGYGRHDQPQRCGAGNRRRLTDVHHYGQ